MMEGKKLKSNFGRVKQALGSLSLKRKKSKKSDDVKKQRSSAEELTEKALEENFSKSKSNLSPQLKLPKDEQKSPIHSPVNSPRATTNTRKNRSSENHSGESEVSSRVAHQAKMRSSNHRRMASLFEAIENQYSNIDHDDLIKVFRWELKKNDVAISQEDVDSFLKLEKAKWDSEGDCQLAKWKRHYSPVEHELVNMLDRQACFAAFSELSKKYKVKTNKSGEKYMELPKGMAAEDARKEITAFMRPEKKGAEFRWAKSPDLKSKIMALNQRLNVPDAAFFGYYGHLSNAFIADREFQIWNGSAEQAVSTETAPTSPRTTAASPFSKTLRSEFIGLHLTHLKLTRKDEKIYTPGENGREYLSLFIVGEVKRNPGYAGWPEDAQKAFVELLDAFQNKEKRFDPIFWANFRDIMLKDPVVSNELKLAQQQRRRKAVPSNDVIVPEPLKFEDPGIKHLLEPNKFSKADFLSLSYEKHRKAAETFDYALWLVTKEAAILRPDIKKSEVEAHLLPKAKHFDLQKEKD